MNPTKPCINYRLSDLDASRTNGPFTEHVDICSDSWLMGEKGLRKASETWRLEKNPLWLWALSTIHRHSQVYAQVAADPSDLPSVRWLRCFLLDTFLRGCVCLRQCGSCKGGSFALNINRNQKAHCYLDWVGFLFDSCNYDRGLVREVCRATVGLVIIIAPEATACYRDVQTGRRKLWGETQPIGRGCFSIIQFPFIIPSCRSLLTSAYIL